MLNHQLPCGTACPPGLVFAASAVVGNHTSMVLVGGAMSGVVLDNKVFLALGC